MDDDEIIEIETERRVCVCDRSLQCVIIFSIIFGNCTLGWNYNDFIRSAGSKRDDDVDDILSSRRQSKANKEIIRKRTCCRKCNETIAISCIQSTCSCLNSIVDMCISCSANDTTASDVRLSDGLDWK